MLLDARQAAITLWFHHTVGDYADENVSFSGFEYQRSEPLKKRICLSEGSGKTMIALALVSLLALPVFCLFPHHAALALARQNTRMRTQEMMQRASGICIAMGAANPTIGEPQFIVQTFRPHVPHAQRRLWVVECLAGPHRYNMIFNDLTGNIESMFADGLNGSARAAAVPVVTLTSSNAAVEGSIRRLKDLQMVPKGTRITLAEPPQCNLNRTAWRLVWKVRRPDTASPYEVRMVLNGSDATPIMVVNCSEL